MQNKDQDISEEDYRTAALHTGAFEYEGIRAVQEKKEFWFNLVSAGLIIGLTIVCTPAGLVAGGIYTAIDVAGAVKGEDLISGRKLSDDERIMRGVFSVVPVAGGLVAKTILRNVPALANVLKTASKTVDDAIKPIKNTVSSTISTAKKLSASASKQLNYMLRHPLNTVVTTKAGQETILKTARFIDKLGTVKVRTIQTTTGENVGVGFERVASDGKWENKANQYLAVKQAERDRELLDKGFGEGNIVKEVKEVDFGKHRLPDDDGGHLIGAQFNGPSDIDNLVPQNSQINRKGGAWYEMETEWANALKEIPPKKVSVSIEPVYSNNSMRPNSFIVEYEIEGQFPVIRDIANKSGG